MTRLVAAVLALLAFPAAAGAAPLGELPFEQRKGITGCVEATGAPGGLSVMGPYSRRASSTDLLTAAGGRTARVSLGRLLDCAAVAEAPGGAAIVAGAAVSRASGDYRAAMRVAVRDPGGAFGPASGLDDSFGRPAVAIAPSGAAVVAWVAGEDRPDAVRRLVVARRPPGGAFGAPETVLSWNPPLYLSWELHAGIDDAGTSTVLLSRDVVDERGDARNIEVATAAADAPFATQVLAERVEGGGEPVLAVAPDGWAIVAHGRAERQPPSVFERAPGASFTPVTLPEAPGPRRVIRDAKVAIRSGGGAIVAWRRGKFGSLSGVDAMVRESAGPFTARRVAEPREPIAVGGELTLDFIDVLDAPPIDFDGASLDVALTADRVLLAWPAPAGRAPLAVLGVRAAFGRLDGTFEPVQDLGTTARDVHDLAAQFTADGRGAVVWTDHTTYPGRGRLHTALEGAAATSPPAPGLRVVAKEHQRLYPSEPVRVLVVCDAACDLRTAVGGIGPRSFSRGAGTHTIPVGPAAGFRPGATQRVRVLVQASAPGGEQTTARTRRVTVTTLRSPPLREPLQVKARRAGDDIVVTWRTAKPARRQRIFVIGNNFRAADGGFDPTAYEPVNGGGRRRFRVRLRPADPDLIRSVTVLVEGYDSGEDGPVKTVRVRSPRA